MSRAYAHQLFYQITASNTMKTYKVIEKRTVVVEYEIEAESEKDACELNGNILDEQETNNYAEELISCVEI